MYILIGKLIKLLLAAWLFGLDQGTEMPCPKKNMGLSLQCLPLQRNDGWITQTKTLLFL